MDFENQQYISQLVLLFLKGELSDLQIQELNQWRAESSKHEEMFQRMISMENFSLQVKRYVKSRLEREKEWKIIRDRTIAKEKQWVLRHWIGYAAVLLVPLVVGIVWYVFDRHELEKETETSFISTHSRAVLVISEDMEVDLEDGKAFSVIDDLKEEIVVDKNQLDYQGNKICGSQESHILKVPRGGEYTLILADGSRVFLNAESQIKYPVAFHGNIRQVFLEGEAYFEVAKDVARPFIVEANGMQVKVLGTEFAVRAYPEEEEILATLVEGQVNVMVGKYEAGLQPNQQAVWRKTMDELSVGQVNVDLFVGWKNGRLVFDNTPLSQILNELGRWYDFKTEYKNPKLKLLPFSLDIEKYTDVSQVLGLLEQTGRVKFSISGNQVMVNE